MTRFVLPAAALLATTTLAFAPPAAATTLTRTFVSAAGSDSNPCTISQPCATFAHAYSVTANDGIIAALDPGKYGPLTITGPITINGNGWAAVTAPSASTGIVVQAGPNDKVELIGLEIDGAGAGYNGIFFNGGASLTVTNCVLGNFLWNGSGFNSGNGILMELGSGSFAVTITNTTASNNGFAGINYFASSGSPSANIVIDHVITDANARGIFISTNGATGGTTNASISNSIASENGIAGIIADNGTGTTYRLSIDSVYVTANNTGIEGLDTTQVVLGRSVVTGNHLGTENLTSPNTFYSYQNNQINLNDTDVGGAFNTTFTFR